MWRKGFIAWLLEGLQSKANFFCGILLPCNGKTYREELQIFLIYFLCSMVFTAASAQDVASKKFRASVVKVDITPSDPQMLAGYAARQSTGVLLAR